MPSSPGKATIGVTAISTVKTGLTVPGPSSEFNIGPRPTNSFQKIKKYSEDIAFAAINAFVRVVTCVLSNNFPERRLSLEGVAQLLLCKALQSSLFSNAHVQFVLFKNCYFVGS